MRGPGSGDRPTLTPRDVPIFPNKASSAANAPPPSRVYVGVSAGLAAGLTLTVLESVAAGIRGDAEHVTASLFAWIALLDLTLASTIGFLAGLAAMAVDEGEGPVARIRRFVEGGCDSSAVRASAMVVAMSVFIEMSIVWGQWIAGRFNNALLAALLYVGGQAVLALPAVALGRLAERKMSFRNPFWPVGAVFVATAALGATLAPYLDLLELAGIPLVVIMGVISAQVGLHAHRSPGHPGRRSQLIVVGAMATAALPVALVALPAALAAPLTDTTFIAGWLAAL